ncbi:thiamine pyrophosphate-binding protein [Streptomyces sp. JJ66]|uniref:thiamine pyrophosphate-binding protein n=1 Tax=Streptomyces sp. JJ66 TaxID=2803843 RepID=UPI001C573F02|nr:thiamine pyrophosphate-binding protein [Streptomyces sp. JJ66]MBW1602243.1 thiamine pyrophosphate-binding protein [Streptomyces sp. JJ66]
MTHSSSVGTTRSRVTDYIADFLRAQGVHNCFGVGGANIEDLYDALHHTGEPMRALVAKHEFSAAAMADGHYRASGRPAALAVTSGAGAMNLVPGLAELRASQIPVLALIGQPPAKLDGHGSFQETSGLGGTLSAERLFSQLAVYCARVEEAEDIRTLLPEAWARAQAEPAGPAVLLLPKDVQQSVLTSWAPPAAVRPARRPPASARRQREAARVLAAAGTEPGGVVVIAGRGVASANARNELLRLSDALGAAVAVAPDARDVFDNRHPRFLGVTGAIGHGAAEAALRRAAAVLLAGTRLPQLAGGPLRERLKDVPVVGLCDRRPYLAADQAALVHLDGPLRQELVTLTELLPAPPETTQATPTPPSPATADILAAPLDMRTAVTTLAGQLPDGAVVVCDAGNCGATAIHHLPTPPGGRFVVAQGMGGMGHSFGAAVGACLATGAPTFVVAGDGAFLMHGLEVHTAAELQLPITFLILNNNAHAMCHTREHVFFNAEYSYNLFRPTRIAEGVAAMFPHLPARGVRTAGELRQTLQARPGSGPLLISVDVDHREMPPFTPFRPHTRTTEAIPPNHPSHQNSERPWHDLHPASRHPARDRRGPRTAPLGDDPEGGGDRPGARPHQGELHL